MNHITYLKNEFPNQIDLIQEHLERKWGIMTPQHMVEHLSMLFIISNGKVKAPSFYSEEKERKRKIGFFDLAMPMPRDFSPQGDRKLDELRFENMEEAKEKLKITFEQYLTCFEANPATTFNHPVFGMLNYDEWNNFHARHIQHHLIQFGILEE